MNYSFQYHFVINKKVDGLYWLNHLSLLKFDIREHFNEIQSIPLNRRVFLNCSILLIESIAFQFHLT